MIPTEKKLMRLNKAELRKLLRSAGKEANVKLREWKSNGTWNKLPMVYRSAVSQWVRDNKGNFYQSPRQKVTKKELVQYLRHALAFLDKPAPSADDPEIDDETAKAADKFSQFYDPSTFWRIYWLSTDRSNDNKSRRETFEKLGKEIANEANTAADFYVNLENKWLFGW